MSRCRLTPEERYWSLARRFWSRVDASGGPHACWLWVGKAHIKTYGVISSTTAHRVSWVLHNGPIPGGCWILHVCDNPPCVNPDHLYLGSARDNSRDKRLRGHSNKGKRLAWSPQARANFTSIMRAKRTPEWNARIGAGVRAAAAQKRTQAASWRCTT